MHRLILPALLLTLWGCAAGPSESLSSTCAPNTYLAHEALEAPWHYRSTLLEAGPFEGQGSLQRAALEIIDDELHVMVDGGSVASWPITRRLDVQCVSGEVQEVTSAEGEYLDVSWSTPGEAHQIPLPEDGMTHFQPAAPAKLARLGDGFEFTERGEIRVDPGTCSNAPDALGHDVDCVYRGLLRRSLKPVRNLDFIIQEDDLIFGVNTRGAFATRAHAVPTYYLPPEAPAALVAAAQDAALEIQRVLPEFKILANDCNAQHVEAVLARTEISAVSGPLSEQCDALQYYAPDQFQWQRPGGLQYNTISLTTSSDPVGWGTYAAAAVDPTTAEIVAVDLFVDLKDLAQIADRVRTAAANPDFDPLLALATERTEAMRRDAAQQPLMMGPASVPRAEFALRRASTRAIALDLLHLADDPYYAALTLDPPWRGEALSPAQRIRGQLSGRISNMLAERPREAAAQWMRSGHSFLNRWQHPGHGLTASILTMAPDDAATIVQAGLLRHRLLHGLLESMGLADNPGGSSQGPHALLDTLPAERQHLAQTLGTYETAALKALYLGEAPAGPLAWCTIEAAMLTPSLDCAIDDWGQTARASLAHAYGRWVSHYPITHTVLSPEHRPSAHDATRPALDVLWRASLAAQEFAFEVGQEASFAQSARGLDLSAAARIGANFGAEVIALPRRGRYCAVPGTDPVWLVPAEFAGEACDASLALDHPDAIAQGQIEVPDGVGRDHGLVRPGMNAAWTRVGATIDQSNVLWGMILSFPSVYEPGRESGVGLIDAVPEVARLYDRLLESNPYFVAFSQADALGSRWCDGPSASQIVDPLTGLTPAQTCAGGPQAALATTFNFGHVTQAIFLTQLVTPERRLRLYRVGVDDQGIDWGQLEPAQLCSFSDLEGSEWRAIRTEDARACGMLEQAQDVRDTYESRPVEIYRQFYDEYREAVDAAHRLGSLSEP